MGISRRALLKGGILAGSTLPFLPLEQVVNDWHAAQARVPVLNDAPVVKLNSNENPYGPSKKAREAIIATIDKGNRYPRPQIKKLTEQLAEYENLSPDQIIITSGSTELLGVVGLMAGLEKGRVIACDPTFDFMLYFAHQFGAEWVKVPLTEDHKYNLPGINDTLNSDTNLVFVCNPNNPTGSELPRATLEPFCTTVAERCMVYVDEAYIEFSQHGLKSSLADLTMEHKNIVVARTFSKIYGLAGLRIGYAIGHPDTIKNIRNHLQGRSITASATSVAAAHASLGDQEFLKSCKKMTDEAKSQVYAAFDSWGVEYIPSSTNFVFFKTEQFGGKDIVKELQRQNVLIRSYQHVPGWARVSIGTLDEMQSFIGATKGLLA